MKKLEATPTFIFSSFLKVRIVYVFHARRLQLSPFRDFASVPSSTRCSREPPSTSPPRWPTLCSPQRWSSPWSPSVTNWGWALCLVTSLGRILCQENSSLTTQVLLTLMKWLRRQYRSTTFSWIWRVSFVHKQSKKYQSTTLSQDYKSLFL